MGPNKSNNLNERLCYINFGLSRTLEELPAILVRELLRVLLKHDIRKTWQRLVTCTHCLDLPIRFQVGFVSYKNYRMVFFLCNVANLITEIGYLIQ